MVESVETSVPLCRDFVPELIRVVEQGGDESGVSWNVVESLELLLDAGAFKDAHALASSVVAMLGHDRRNRLFEAYIQLCDLIQGAPLRATLERIDALVIEIEHGGFSDNDRCWAGIVLARAVAIGVYTHDLPEADILRARVILALEFSKGLTSEFSIGASQSSALTHIKVGLELARTYVHCPKPELPAARELLSRLVSLCDSRGIAPDVTFDVFRLLHQVGGEDACPAERLRALAHPLGGVARGLAELAVARRATRLSASDTIALEKALALFQESSYRSGEFEALIALATSSAECEHHAKASRLFSRADTVATEGGFMYGRGLALLGLFHSAVASGEAENARLAAEKLRGLCASEIFMTAFGLNTVAAHQLIGAGKVAVSLAMKCEKAFASHGLHGLTAQASFMLGASYADAGKWKQARSAWKRALTCDEIRRSYISACDRRAALAQAIVMVDLTEHGSLRDTTLREVEGLRVTSERALAPFGQATEAVHALGKTLHIHAQLAILAKQPLNALKHLNRARESFGTLALQREVALTDGLTGLALLEASKQSGPQLLDEAMSALRRALDFFVAEEGSRVTWKIRYYLAVACILKSQHATDPLHGEAHRQMAAGFLEEASADASLLAVEGGMPRASNGEGDFSPGLQADVLEPLKKVLGLPVRRRKGKPSAKGASQTNAKYGGYLH
jgi:tetratricopeptide (TPR) repeat protein